MVAGLQIVGGSYTEITASLSEVPALLLGDSIATLEGAPVVIDVLANDVDPDTDLAVGMINGLVITTGGTVTIASGARVTLTMQGQLLYDANGAFDALADPASGTSYTSATDSFTYSVTNSETALVESATTTLTELTGQGSDTIFTSLKRFTLPSEIENLNFSGTNGRFYGYGNALNNIIEGGNQGDFLIGYQGNDVLRGGAGNDVLDGGADHDVLDGGLGGDAMIGGGDNDIYYIDSLNDVIIEGADPGYDTVFTTLTSYTLADWVENLSFSGIASYFGIGNAVGNQIQGSISHEVIHGMAGNDRLIGFGGNDTLDGGDGDDLLQGGIGSDHLIGGFGSDQFRFDTSILNGDIDTLADFDGSLDQIQLSRAIFSALDLGALSASAFVSGTEAQDSDDRIIYDAVTGSLFYDADGNGAGAAIKFASVAPQTPIDETAFVVI